MSRTYRKRLPGYGPNEPFYIKSVNHHVAGIHPCRYWSHLGDGYDHRKDHWMHGRDAYGSALPLGYALAHAPKGYGYKEVFGLRGKRSVKRQVSRIIRYRAGREIFDQLID